MKIVSLNGQMTFDEMKGSLERLPKSNRWVQKGNKLPWAEFEKVYNKSRTMTLWGRATVRGAWL